MLRPERLASSSCVSPRPQRASTSNSRIESRSFMEIPAFAKIAVIRSEWFVKGEKVLYHRQIAARIFVNRRDLGWARCRHMDIAQVPCAHAHGYVLFARQEAEPGTRVTAHQPVHARFVCRVNVVPA